jgi:hypothetical protein
MRKLRIILLFFSTFVFTTTGYGLATEQIGPDKSNRFPTVAQPGWPKGLIELLRHPSRVYSIWVNGNENFHFKATPEEINELLSLFSKTRLRDHEVLIKPGTNTVKSFRGDSFDYNVSLQILSGIALAFSRDKERTDTHEPRLTIYAGEGTSLLKRLKLPANTTVASEVDNWNFKGRKTKPVRKAWYGCVQFEDARSAVDIEHGLSTRITLWEKDFADGIALASVRREGIFMAVFSEKEIADLKKGASWLTITVGNHLSEPKKEDPKFPADLLTLDKEKATPQKISRPPFYHGRLLFEDGSPPRLEPEPWPGAEIHVDFPYAGMARPDAEGYFKVYFEREQFENLKAQKPGKNIYCPTSERGRSTAMEVFPVELLSPDKAQAGVVKIPKPVFKIRLDPAKAPSLAGKPLPQLADFKLALPAETLRDKMMLLCFFDLQQRPSRACLSELVKQAKALEEKGEFVIAIQDSKVEPGDLKKYVAENGVPFPVGTIETDEEQTRLNWGLKAQPWLILTDKEHNVQAEGFAPSELNEKLQTISQSKAANPSR